MMLRILNCPQRFVNHLLRQRITRHLHPFSAQLSIIERALRARNGTNYRVPRFVAGFSP